VNAHLGIEIFEVE